MRTFPADRCQWIIEDSTDGVGYAISNARFHPNTGALETITNPRFGYIGKTGRFVPVTDVL